MHVPFYAPGLGQLLRFVVVMLQNVEGVLLCKQQNMSLC